MADNDSILSRRKAFGAAGIGLAVAAAGPALAQAPAPAQPTAQPLQDPRTKYPKPPFHQQSQP